jgi:hypothetical protein
MATQQENRKRLLSRSRLLIHLPKAMPAQGLPYATLNLGLATINKKLNTVDEACIW